jgi:hypothetical protein
MPEGAEAAHPTVGNRVVFPEEVKEVYDGVMGFMQVV